MNQSDTTIQGIYEVTIGVEHPLTAIQYWQQFGYRIGDIGELPAAAAKQLYGVNSHLHSIRLYHQDADHGLIRLLVWEQPINEGLQMETMKALGNRWVTAMTADILNILNHAELAAKEMPIKYTNAYWSVIYATEKVRPFMEPIVGIREMLLRQPRSRQVFFERFNYTVPNYGKIHPDSFFKTSQITHAGIVVQDDSKESLRFYEEVLGLLRTLEDVSSTYDNSPPARDFFDLQPGESFAVTAFDDPRSSKVDWKAARSGRLYVVRFPEALKLKNLFEWGQPGCLGMSFYTYRVRGLEVYWQRIKASAATNVSDITANEFGELSFSFVAPDGYFWTLISQ
ncbi:MAG TPA: VOC family protein [Oscillatoriaceae cyanobacterium M33_DOE_052]|uniref:VOC family protein n=1 Tax=Planktothricoides sp. SpSt-374 TaxID=2282167 RepID=A0A7C3VFK6_9CYAN|nr:VOC family protein [Oscillatoriaceae cyanobacterium M33_DOE_052]